MSKSVFGATFDRVVVVNLDRRVDRMSSLRTQLAALGIAYERHSAVDGKRPEVADEWQAYLRADRPNSTERRQVESWRDFYLGDKPHAARVAYFERQNDGRGIATAGAWGLFQSMREVIKKALKDNVKGLLILEDDALFHRDTVALWKKVAGELPNDWQILQLGAMQLHWEDDWIEWHSQHLYKCQGSSIAAHAVALRRPAMRAILERAAEPDLPFDVGPLQEVKRLFRDDCYTAYPNLVIQDPGDSEIGMSTLFADEARKADNIYRWDWDAYGPDVLRPKGGGHAAPAPAPRCLQPYGAPLDAAERILIVFGPDSAQDAQSYISMLETQKASGEIAPIVLIDDLGHVPALREAKLAFEYIPPTDLYVQALPEDRYVELVQMRRLSILRRKWLPTRIMALGDAGQALLAMWRNSPFERFDLASDLASDEDLLGVSE